MAIRRFGQGLAFDFPWGFLLGKGCNDKRILCTRGPDLFALDALTGKPIPSFGNNGKVDIRSGMPESAKEKFVISNTPGAIYKDLIVMPLRLSEGAGAPSGDVIAFNVVTGEVAWVFHTIPHPRRGRLRNLGEHKRRTIGMIWSERGK